MCLGTTFLRDSPCRHLKNTLPRDTFFEDLSNRLVVEQRKKANLLRRSPRTRLILTLPFLKQSANKREPGEKFWKQTTFFTGKQKREVKNISSPKKRETLNRRSVAVCIVPWTHFFRRKTQTELGILQNKASTFPQNVNDCSSRSRQANKNNHNQFGCGSGQDVVILYCCSGQLWPDHKSLWMISRRVQDCCVCVTDQSKGPRIGLVMIVVVVVVVVLDQNKQGFFRNLLKKSSKENVPASR